MPALSPALRVRVSCTATRIEPALRGWKVNVASPPRKGGVVLSAAAAEPVPWISTRRPSRTSARSSLVLP